MFSLDDTMRYWLYNKPVNMRMGFNGLSGIVNNNMGMNIRSGDVFVFVNAARNRMKILHREEGGPFRFNERKETADVPVRPRTDAFRYALAGGRTGSTGCGCQKNGGAERKDHRGEVPQA